jgi:N-acetylmuramate 1-kinase
MMKIVRSFADSCKSIRRMTQNKLSPEQARSLLGEWGEPGDFELLPLAGDGSDRVYYRLQYPDYSRVLMWNPRPVNGINDLNDNDSFDRIGRLIYAVDQLSPKLYHTDLKQGAFLLEDLGDQQLYHIVQRTVETTELTEIYREVLRDLARMSAALTPQLETVKLHNPVYDAPFMREWEGGYFQQRLLSLYPQLDFDIPGLESELDALSLQAEATAEPVFIYRDFQSRNIMRYEERWRYLDFQGGRLGPSTYDPASLLIDPYVNLDARLQEELIEFYRELQRGGDQFRENYQLVALHRNMQALGAYGFLSAVKGKISFTRYIPAGVTMLQRRLRHPLFEQCTTLRTVADQLAEQV